MKRLRYFVYSVVLGMIVGFGVEKATKRKKYLAKEAGEHIPFGPYEAFLKRPLDILLAGSSLVLLSQIGRAHV